ncbi:3-isopropylmalate dehydrogenase [Caldalkalibacillus salinus]|uniref:3-isopropylmalate dehydrogenase n=1 Tax=Caldalkalibacillus salinus TaxID=2803787 RepID=UPI001924BB4E|nr:3-isopropylmalate dehydrogenase [Caldalkalibacillus salinus]
MKKKIMILPGDGIGPEVAQEGRRVLEHVGRHFGHSFEINEGLIGGHSLDTYGEPLTDEVLQQCKDADAVLLGAVGGPKWDQNPGELRPEKALLKLRKELGLFANLRPVEVLAPLATASPLKKEIVADVDLLVVRELTGGLYFGKKEQGQTPGGENWAVDELIYSEHEVERIAHVAFQTARKRRNKVTSVDKANVLESSRLWRATVERVHTEYPDVELEHMLVDNAAMQLIRSPKQFDVVVTENMFGDILSDEASVLAGSIGLMPSASLSASAGLGLYESVHGSAPDIAGQEKANPLATILSVAMLLRHSFDLNPEAQLIEKAVKQVIKDGYRTLDIGQGETVGETQVLGTTDMTDAVISRLDQSITQTEKVK